MLNLLRKAGMIILVAAITSLSGCQELNRNTADKTCEILREKYGIPFVATHIGDRMDKTTAKLYLHPENDEHLVFTAIIDAEGNVEDDYVANVILHQLERQIENSYQANGMECAANAVLPGGIICEADPGIAVDEFLKNHSVTDILVYTITDTLMANAGDILAAVKDSCQWENCNFVIKGYILEPSQFDECYDKFLKYPSVGATQIEDYGPVCSYKVCIQNGNISVSEEELKQMLEGK